jgi:hypothetical protein
LRGRRTLKMTRQQDKNLFFSRRSLLRGMRWAPVLLLPAPIQAHVLGPSRGAIPDCNPAIDFADYRVTPHYPAKSPLEDLLRKAVPGTDEYVTEKYAAEITRLLEAWSEALKVSTPATEVLAKFLDASIQATSLVPAQQNALRSGSTIEGFRRRFAAEVVSGRERFLQEMKTYLAAMSRVETAKFEITGIEEVSSASGLFRANIRYDLAGASKDAGREQRVGNWKTQWTRSEVNEWRAVRWEATEETLSRARGPVFVDVTSQALGDEESYRKQMLHGVDHWRTVLDGACGIDIYGNNGLAVGDIDNDGLDDLYVC